VTNLAASAATRFVEIGNPKEQIMPFGATATRAEHLQACKDRANEYVDAGDLEQAFASMASDLRKHPETESHNTTVALGMSLMMGGHLSTPQKMREFINGFN
jgi:hypothetical protein